jgi:hypothetical protein
MPLLTLISHPQDSMGSLVGASVAALGGEEAQVKEISCSIAGPVVERRTNGHDKKEANNGGQAYRFDINSRQDEASNYTVLKRFWLSHTKKFT